MHNEYLREDWVTLGRPLGRPFAPQGTWGPHKGEAPTLTLVVMLDGGLGGAAGLFWRMQLLAERLGRWTEDVGRKSVYNVGRAGLCFLSAKWGRRTESVGAM